MPLDYLISQLRVVFKMLKEKKHELMIIYPGKLLFRKRNKAFLKLKLRELATTRPPLQKIVERSSYTRNKNTKAYRTLSKTIKTDARNCKSTSEWVTKQL